MKFDLHCHSTASDGKLTPHQVLAQAEAENLSLFALTDHDTVRGVEALLNTPKHLQFITGIELSSVWGGASVHIVGLDFDIHHRAIQQLIQQLREAREKRAWQIDSILAKHGMPNTLQGALQFCPDMGQVGRPHFAEYLCQQGYVDTAAKAFDSWLGNGKECDIKLHWPALGACIEAITASGGIAVLAHPLRYKMTFTKLCYLMDEFAQLGGRAVEVSNTQMEPERRKQLCSYVDKKQLAGSGGADFHNPAHLWSKIGQIPSMPDSIQPVWQLFTRTAVNL